MDKDDLTKLAVKYKSDRHPGSKHSYTPFYYKLFKDKRHQVKKVLEIGVGEGSGLRMWRDFFPNAMIYGAENDTTRIFSTDRIEVIHCDQTYRGDLESLIAKTGPDIDLLVEDGSHVPAHQVFTCQVLMPLLEKKVIYVIEDVADPTIVQKLAQYALAIPDLVPKKTRYDDRLVVVKHQV